jgi:hypothetical protein
MRGDEMSGKSKDLINSRCYLVNEKKQKKY